MGRRFLLTAVICAGCAAGALAVNGIAISESHYPTGPIGAPGWQNRPAGALVKFTVQNNAAVRCDTLFPYSKGLAQYGALNHNATKAAFFRWGVIPVVRSGQYHYPDPAPGQYTATYFSDSNWISVVNIDGTGLRNLVAVDWPDVKPGECTAPLDWPYGDWVYYEKPMHSAEIRRVNVNNPLLHEFVVKLKGDDGTTDPNFDKQVPLWLRRFSLSLDATICAAQMINYVNNTAFCFPPSGGDKTQCDPSDGGVGGCNISVSASGHYFGHYLWAGHCAAEIRYWDGTPTGSINAENFQTSTYCGSELIRWSVNSDQWFMQSTSNDGKVLVEGWASGVNQSIANPVTKAKFKTSSNGSGRDNTAGDFWVETSDANYGKYQDWDGNWIAVQPPKPLDHTPPSVPAGLQASATDPHSANLNWSTASDAESGVYCYCVFRDGAMVDTVHGTAFTDTSLAESQQYSWQVSAINGNGIESAKSSAALATTPVDNAAPAIIALDQTHGPNHIHVVFDEPVEQSSATSASNYSIDGSANASSSAMVAPAVVDLTIPNMTIGQQYTVQVTGVTDQSAAKNAANSSMSLTYQGIVRGLKYTTTLGASGISPVVDNNLRGGSNGGIEFTGLLNITQRGEYRFIGCAYGEYAVYVNNVKIIGYGTEVWNHLTEWGKADLATGYVPFRVTANTNVLYLGVEGPDRIRGRIPAEMLFHTSDGQPVNEAGRMPASHSPRFGIAQSDGHLTVSVDAPGEHAVRLVSASGRVVRRSAVSSGKPITLNTRSLPTGVYVLQILGQDTACRQPVVLGCQNP